MSSFGCLEPQAITAVFSPELHARTAVLSRVVHAGHGLLTTIVVRYQPEGVNSRYLMALILLVIPESYHCVQGLPCRKSSYSTGMLSVSPRALSAIVLHQLKLLEQVVNPRSGVLHMIKMLMNGTFSIHP